MLLKTHRLVSGWGVSATASRGRVTGGVRGISLLELLVVLALVGLLATMSLPMVQRARSSLAFAADTRVLIAELRKAREIAMASRTSVSMRVILSEPGIVATGAARPILLTSIDQLVIINSKGIEEVPAGNIRFEPDGSSSGAEIKLRSESAVRVVKIDWLTGAVSSNEIK